MADDASATSIELMSHVDACLADSGLMQNPYFRQLISGEMSYETFSRSQQQFYFAVNYFPRPMLALMMRMPRGVERLSILENVVEEHGHFRVEMFHESTFREFLQAIGRSGERPDAESMRPAVHAFNATIMSACQSDDVTTGIACLGIIEYAFADISSMIGAAVIERGWVTADGLVHYKLHREIDKQHAADFFDLIRPAWQSDHGRLPIIQGMRLGAYAFDSLYRNLIDC